MTKETSEHRLWHMRQLVRSVGGTNEAARITGKRNSYITQIAGPKPTRQIGDKLAAQIELAFGLPSGSLHATAYRRQPSCIFQRGNTPHFFCVILLAFCFAIA